MRNTAWKGGFLQYSFRKISLFFWQNSMVQRVSMINSNKTQLNSDYDFSMLRKWLLWNQGGVESKTHFSFDVSTKRLSAGADIAVAYILCTRPSSSPIPNQQFLAHFEFTGTLDFLNITDGDKIFIEIKENLIKDPTLIEDLDVETNYAQGLGIGEIKMAKNYPGHNNYLKLYEWNWGKLVDHRKEISIPALDSVSQRTTTLESKVATQEEKVGKLEEAGAPDHLEELIMVWEVYWVWDHYYAQTWEAQECKKFIRVTEWRSQDWNWNSTHNLTKVSFLDHNWSPIPRTEFESPHFLVESTNWTSTSLDNGQTFVLKSPKRISAMLLTYRGDAHVTHKPKYIPKIEFSENGSGWTQVSWFVLEDVKNRGSTTLNISLKAYKKTQYTDQELKKLIYQKPLFSQKRPKFEEAILGVNIWEKEDNKELHLQAISNWKPFNSIEFKLNKIWLPTANLEIEVKKSELIIENNSGLKVRSKGEDNFISYWVGVGSALAKWSIWYSTIQQTPDKITVILDKELTLPAWELLSVVVKQSGWIVNSQNYYVLSCDSTQYSEWLSFVAVNGDKKVRSQLMPYLVCQGFVNNIAAKSSSTEIIIPQLETYLFNRNWADFVFEDENDPMFLFVAPTDMEIEAEITFRGNIWPRLGGLWNFYVNVNETKILEVYVSYWGNTGKKSNKIKVKKWDVISITKNANSFWASNPKVGIAMQNFYIRAFLTSISKQKTNEVIYAREQKSIGQIVKCTTFGRHIDGKRIDRNFFTPQVSSSVRTGNIPLGNAIWFMPFVSPDGKTYKIPIFWD